MCSVLVRYGSGEAFSAMCVPECEGQAAQRRQWVGIAFAESGVLVAYADGSSFVAGFNGEHAERAYDEKGSCHEHH